MTPPVPIPADVRSWLLDVFGTCNERISKLITDVPTTHETPLDMTFIQHFLGVSVPFRFPSGWTVDLSTHYLGGGRHWGDWPDWPRRWEIADIGLLILFRQGAKLLRSKVALLQSKRLYPDELDWDEDSPLDYKIGFRRLFRDDDEHQEKCIRSHLTFPTDPLLRRGCPRTCPVSRSTLLEAIKVENGTRKEDQYLGRPWLAEHALDLTDRCGCEEKDRPNRKT